jgi:hypothetical protein
MDDNDNAIITWQQPNSSKYQIYISEYRSGSWTHPADADDNISPDAEDGRYPHPAMDNNGNAIITWRQTDGTNNRMAKSEYRSGSWTHPVDENDVFNPDEYTSGYPRVAMDDNGNAMITWYQSDGAYYQIYKSEYRSGAWTHPTGLTDHVSPDGQDAESPRVAMDDNGNAIIVWHSDGPNNKIFMSEFR